MDHNDYQCDHTAWGVLVMGLVNSPRVKLLYDIYHMQIMEGDIIRTIREVAAPHIGHVHTRATPVAATWTTRRSFATHLSCRRSKKSVIAASWARSSFRKVMPWKLSATPIASATCKG